MDTAKYSYYIRTAGVPAAALPNVAGPGKLVFDYGDSAAYLIEAATAADLEAVAAKLEVWRPPGACAEKAAGISPGREGST